MLIGFTGKPGAGKSAAADYVAKKYGLPRINVGDPIKEMLRGFYRSCNLPEDQMERRIIGDLKEAPDPLLNGKTPRYAMQTIGKEWRDLISTTLFADRYEDKVRAAGGAASDGMRYHEELPPFRRLGGVLVRVTRPGEKEGVTDHVAEKQQLQEDVLLSNDGDIGSLHRKLDDLIVGAGA